jgi:Transposase
MDHVSVTSAAKPPRQVIESVNQTFKAQFGLERHGGRTIAGVIVRRKFDTDFREGAVRLVRETGKPIAKVARDLGGSTRAPWATG